MSDSWLMAGYETADAYTVLDPHDTGFYFRPEYRKLRCPLCGDTYQHPSRAQQITGEDYESGWEGRGDLTLIPFTGECGHSWELCFGFHKGETMCFIRVSDAVDEDGSQA